MKTVARESRLCYNMRHQSKTKDKNMAIKLNDHSKFIHRIDALVQGKSTTEPEFGTVKCVKAAKATKNGRRLFSVSGSKVAKNRSGYTFSKLMDAFGLHR